MIVLTDVIRLERPLVGIDTETTGTNPERDRIVELGLEIFTPQPDGTVKVKEWRTLLNPGCPIPPGATAVHHITDDDVRDAPTFAQLAENLLRGMTDVDFAGCNVRFDLRMLLAEFKRAGKTWSYEGAAVLDCYRLEQIAKPRSLEHLANDYLGDEKDEVTGQAHTALGDVKWSTRIIAAQLRQHATLPRDVRKLHALCNPGEFDAEGKLRWRDGELCIAFGQHKDTPLRAVPRSYLKWMYERDFSDLIKKTVRDAAHGIYPTPPDVASPEGESEDA